MLQTLDDARFGKMEKDGKTLYRYVAKDYRIYFEVIDGKVVVHRVLHANSLNDFLFRTNISPTAGEDEILSQSKHCLLYTSPLGQPYLFRTRDASKDALTTIFNGQIKKLNKKIRRGQVNLKDGEDIKNKFD